MSHNLIQHLLNIHQKRYARALMKTRINHSKTIHIVTRAFTPITIASKNVHRLRLQKISIIGQWGPAFPEAILKTLLLLNGTSARADGNRLSAFLFAQSVIHQHHGIVECTATPKKNEFKYIDSHWGRTVRDQEKHFMTTRRKNRMDCWRRSLISLGIGKDIRARGSIVVSVWFRRKT